MKKENVKKLVKESYSKVAKTGCCCSCNSLGKGITKMIGYSDSDMKAVPEANLGLGCGNPTALAGIKEGDFVLDLGSGAGIDCFIASRKAGKSGKVIGVDMTEEMVERAKSLASKHGYDNIEFRLGDIESLPVDDDSIDIIITNCVVNLAPDKLKAFKEAFRVLKKTGRMVVSDIVLLEELSEEQRKDKKLLAGCVAGALLKEDYISKLKAAGFKVKVLGENREISKRQYKGIALESITIEARK